MTVSSTSNKNVYNGLIGQDVFAYTYLVNNVEDMTVYLAGIAISDSAWTIDGLGQDIGGNVTLNTPLAVDQTVTLLREIAETQEVDYQPFDAFPAETHEGALDKLTMLVQQLTEVIERNPIPPPDSQPGEGDYLIDGDLYAENAYMSQGAFAVDAPVVGTALTNLDYVNSRFDALQTVVATGLIAPFPYVPSDVLWLRCSGQAISRTDYSILFSVIGTTYGVGDGSTTFNVPDYRGRFLRDMDQGAGIDPDGSRVMGSEQADEVGPHSHVADDHSHGLPRAESTANQTGSFNSGDQVLDHATVSANASVIINDSTGAESRPANTAIQYFIFAGRTLATDPGEPAGSGAFTEDVNNNIFSDGAGQPSTGTFNFLAGDGAGRDLTTGDRNVAIGEDALATVQASSGNIAMGWGALTLGSGTDNVAIGNQAGRNLLGGSFNTIVGGSAAGDMTSGTRNVVIGHGAMGGNGGGMFGDYNVAIGESALDRATIAAANIAIGLNTLFFCATGLRNIAIGAGGSGALGNVVDGDYNIGIGEQAGRYWDGFGSNNIALGKDVGPVSLIDESDKLYIGNAIGEPFIGGDMATDAFQIKGTMRLKNRTDHIGTPVAGFGELWVNDSNQLVFTNAAGVDAVLA